MRDILLLFLIFLILVVSFIVLKNFYIPLREQASLPSFLEKNEKILNRLTPLEIIGIGKKHKESKSLTGLTLEQKIGQLFIIGFEGKVLSPEIENLIKEMHPGGVLLLGRNIENENQLKELINSLQEIALEDTGLPLFIAVDQEGGVISRVGWIEKTPQSEIENKEQAYQIGQTRGMALKELGINLNLAPLLDVTFSGDFIFKRAFQKSPETIAELAERLIQGQKEQGILTAMKHFPGYGGISFNPEEKLAVFEKIPEISQFEEVGGILPEMIMVSNVVYKKVDEELPFAFSKKGIQFLRRKIKGNYLVISDDLSQNSLLNKFSLKEIVTLPLEAGVDVLIFSGWRMPVEEGILAFQEAVEREEIEKEKIDEAVLKIIEFKNEI